MFNVTRWQRIGTVTLVLLLCLLIPACSSKVNAENFMKIKPGMSEKEVTDILGSPSSKDDGGKVLNWKNGDSTIKLTMKDGKVAGMDGKFGAK
jgi:hypothetical protein